MKAEYEAVKSNQKFLLEDYEQAALHTSAFQYESIRDRQDHKEFQTQMRLVGGTIVGALVTAFCPPVGLALLGVIGLTSGALDIGAAVSGKDLISGRKLGTGERALRGAFGGLDLLPGLGSLSKLSGTIKLARFGDKMAEVGVETGVKEVARQENSNVIQLVRKTDPSTISRIKSTSEAVSDRANVLSFNDAKVKLETKRLLKEEEIIPARKYALPMASGEDVGKVHIQSGNTHTISIDEIHGESVEGAVKGTGDVKEVISETDRAKLSLWKYPPNDELYLKYKHVFNNPKYYDQETGAINWPENDGFLNTPIEETLQPGFRIDRYGYDTGTFVSPEGIPYEMRAVAPGTDLRPYNVFEVVVPIKVKGGVTARLK
ncbi:glycohydrolase toxin TNT-related protein [Bacillus sp. BRMEA1]|uniref:glycohydrolase toxin TNT-related protein n=1 Tax=Neobacillus endophyticus TaxID=2738405 RepID=UPI00156308EF|nr:glycohydrolase toxin TNT-related protein [Neobacillus endophyticus]NRD77656.1 glycohydrolase toxin TNT-related protein [Neobacillus endophyticus]